MKEKLISKEDIKKISPVFRGRFGNILIRFAMWLSGLNKANRVYDNSKHFEGVAFCDHLLKNAGLDLNVENIAILDQFKGKPFITVSNHAYGHMDGIAAIDVVGSVRSDYKMMVNFVLSLIDTMSMHFITVNPYASGKLASRSSLEGVKLCIEHLKGGHPLGFFPAGAVSKTKLKGLSFHVEDREWQDSVIKLIRKAKVPVVPMYFSGKNSWFFNFLDLISWKLRSVRLAHEIANKKGKTMSIRLGEPIMPQEILKYTDIKELGEFLKAKTYALARKGD